MEPGHGGAGEAPAVLVEPTPLTTRPHLLPTAGEGVPASAAAGLGAWLSAPEAEHWKSRADGQWVERAWPTPGTLRQPLSGNNNLGSLINSLLAELPRTTGTPWVNDLGQKSELRGLYCHPTSCCG